MIIFVCKGNLYRSRFAAAFFSQLTGMHAESYGTHIWEGTVICGKFIEHVKQQYKLDVAGNIKHINREILESAHSVYYMSHDNMLALKAYTLKSYEHIKPLVHQGSNVGHHGLDIPDPGYLHDVSTKTFTQDIVDAIQFRFNNGIW